MNYIHHKGNSLKICCWVFPKLKVVLPGLEEFVTADLTSISPNSLVLWSGDAEDNTSLTICFWVFPKLEDVLPGLA